MFSKVFKMVALLFVLVCYQNCSGFDPKHTDSNQTLGSENGSDANGQMPTFGENLYATNCARCHGDLAVTTKPGRTFSQIDMAIDNVPTMNSLSFLTDAEIQAIADALQ